MLLIPVIHLDLRISPRIFENIWNYNNFVFQGLWEDDSWKTWSKKSCNTFASRTFLKPWNRAQDLEWKRVTSSALWHWTLTACGLPTWGSTPARRSTWMARQHPPPASGSRVSTHRLLTYLYSVLSTYQIQLFVKVMRKGTGMASTAHPGTLKKINLQ